MLIYNYALQPMMCRLFQQLFLESVLICLKIGNGTFYAEYRYYDLLYEITM